MYKREQIYSKIFYVTQIQRQSRIIFTSNVLCAQRHINIEQLFYRQGEALLVAHHGHIVQAIKVG